MSVKSPNNVLELLLMHINESMVRKDKFISISDCNEMQKMV